MELLPEIEFCFSLSLNNISKYRWKKIVFERILAPIISAPFFIFVIFVDVVSGDGTQKEQQQMLFLSWNFFFSFKRNNWRDHHQGRKVYFTGGGGDGDVKRSLAPHWLLFFSLEFFKCRCSRVYLCYVCSLYTHNCRPIIFRQSAIFVFSRSFPHFIPPPPLPADPICAAREERIFQKASWCAWFPVNF